jgi:hypothetical protein
MEPMNKLNDIGMWLKMGAISLADAKKMAEPYLDALNQKAREIANRHGKKIRRITFNNVIR